MKMELVQRQLQQWGEVMVTTSSGQTFELHLGDTQFDTQQRIIRLHTPDADYMIDGDAIDVVKWHLGHRD
ncbi:hypothetical protein [Caldinitratiruptor microaerophilus]|uniref:Uncharacterized protein n=1 Tax=Caldinitratiruptor microaerophilus TaxID=671077 RepID=A0AA35CIG7_9FIRM|nr:hypothetical protein [Caldinitratiruptor microaerophilus]BDG58913.1 hypothetical protein caldi_00030 [Caldinitratiruptor microaerophilus]